MGTKTEEMNQKAAVGHPEEAQEDRGSTADSPVQKTGRGTRSRVTKLLDRLKARGDLLAAAWFFSMLGLVCIHVIVFRVWFPWGPFNEKPGGDYDQIMVFAGTAYAHPTNVYPPLVSIVFAAFQAINREAGLILLTLLNLLGLVYLLNRRVDWNRFKPRWFTFFLLLAVGYGTVLEFERVQFNLVTTALAFGGLAWCRKGNPVVGLLLWSVSIHLKLYPLFLFPLFLYQLKQIKHLFAFVMMNLFLAFCGGWDRVSFFLSNISSVAQTPVPSAANLSLQSFAGVLEAKLQIPQLVVLLPTLLLVLAGLVRATSLSFKPPDTVDRGTVESVEMLCLIACLLLPTLSWDYKVPLIIPAIISMGQTGGKRKQIVVGSILGLLSLSYDYKTIFLPLRSNTPVLLGLLVVILLRTSARNRKREVPLDNGSRRGWREST